MATGTVREWHSEEGWGVIESRATPSGCWAHFSHLWADQRPRPKPGQKVIIHSGFRDAHAGETVDFEWERAEQDGYSYRALTVNPRRPGPTFTIEVLS